MSYSGLQEAFPYPAYDEYSYFRKTQIADNHSKTTLLRKYFIAWHIWVRSEQERRELEQAQSSTRNKMMSLLEAAASGKLWQGKEEEVETSMSSSRSSSRLQSARGRQEKRSTADKIVSLFSSYNYFYVY